MNRPTIASLALLLVAAPVVPLPAQDVDSESLPEGQTIEQPFRAPIHTAADVDGQPYGQWASGAGYKVAFHGRMRFFPVLGRDAPRNLPLGWTTTAVEVGGVDLLERETTAAPVTWHTDWRFEYRHGAVTEAYDVLPGSVEQTFVLHQRPAAQGDLTVRGRITTELHADATASRHGALVFRDANGAPVVRYGEAFAIDATGRTKAMRTSFDGASIALTVDASWLRDAVFPVTVDPLLTSVVISNGADMLESAKVAWWSSRLISTELMVAYTRAVSASDVDIYGRICDEDFRNGSLVFIDSNEFVSDRRPEVAVSGFHYIIAFEHQSLGSSQAHRIGYHVRDFGSRVFDTTVYQMAPPLGSSYRHPDVAIADHRALIVFESDANRSNANGPNTEVLGSNVFLQGTVTHSAPFLMTRTPVGNTLDREYPAVTRGPFSGMAAVWQEYDNSVAGDDWDLRVSLVDPAGSVSTPSNNLVGRTRNDTHCLGPKIARGPFELPSTIEFVVLYGARPNDGTKSTRQGGPELRAQRFEIRGSNVNLGVDRFIRSVASFLELIASDIAFDQWTASHWVGVSTYGFGNTVSVYADRLGYDLGAVEQARVVQGWQTHASGVTARGPSSAVQHGSFAIVHSATSVNTQLLGTVMVHNAFRPPVQYGSGCGTPALDITFAYSPLAGNEFFSPLVTGGLPSHPTFLLIHFRRGNQPLDSLGYPGCTLLVPSTAVALLTTSLPWGGAQFRLPLPSTFRGTVNLQGAQLASMTTVLMTPGLEIDVR